MFLLASAVHAFHIIQFRLRAMFVLRVLGHVKLFAREITCRWLIFLAAATFNSVAASVPIEMLIALLTCPEVGYFAACALMLDV